MSEWYFAYGSNLCVQQMIERTGPIRKPPRIAKLANHRLVFNMQSEDGRTFANIKSPGEGVTGVVYACSAEALMKMDAYEKGYERRLVCVSLENGDELSAVTYIAKADHVGKSAQPNVDYLERILTGARQHGLAVAYIREIEAIAKSV